MKPETPEAQLVRLINSDPWRRRVLEVAASLGLPDCWIGAGFVRNAIWDALHGRPPSPLADVDVIFFDAKDRRESTEKEIDHCLRDLAPHVPWSAKNQARMHEKNGDAPYSSSAEAIARWPETATAVAVRLNTKGEIELLAPHGVGDLMGLLVRPTPAYRSKPVRYNRRVLSKKWKEAWPLPTIELLSE